jgi:hypothetical protein
MLDLHGSWARLAPPPPPHARGQRRLRKAIDEIAAHTPSPDTAPHRRDPRREQISGRAASAAWGELGRARDAWSIMQTHAGGGASAACVASRNVAPPAQA